MIHNSKSDHGISRAEEYWQVSLTCQASLEHNWEAYQSSDLTDRSQEKVPQTMGAEFWILVKALTFLLRNKCNSGTV